MKAHAFRRLVVIGARSDIEHGRYRSKMNPKSVLHSLSAFEVRYDLPIYYFQDAESAALQIESWLWWVAREIVVQRAITPTRSADGWSQRARWQSAALPVLLPVVLVASVFPLFAPALKVYGFRWATLH
jgi:hypothetical protein